ncbi:MAG: hypothetical protein ABL998_13220, partial [Planctomycetota bacterium]
GGGGGAAVTLETAGNDTAAGASPLAVARPGSGSLDSTGDIDFWSLALSSGVTYELELLATRLDQVRWDTVVNAPRLTLFDTDGVTKLLEHDLGGFTSDGWGWGTHDLDIPLFRVPASGTYFVSLGHDDVTKPGGDYVFTVRTHTLGGQQSELEADDAMGLNDSAANAEPITPGTVHGMHLDDDVDVFAFTLTQPAFVRFELTAYRNGVWRGDDAYFDGKLRLLDGDGTSELAANDEAFFSDPAVHWRLDTPGTYYIAIEESGGSGDAPWFLSYERTSLAGLLTEVEDNDTTAAAESLSYGQRLEGAVEPGDDDVFVFQASAGDLVRAQLFDATNWSAAADAVELEVLAADGVTTIAAEPDRSFRVHSFVATQSGPVFLSVAADLVSSAYVLALERVTTAAFESENNNSIGNADAFDADGHAAGVIAINNDEDFFSFRAAAGVPVTVRVFAKAAVHSDGFLELSGHGSELQPFVRIRNSAGGAVANTHYGRFIGAEGVLDGLPTCSVAFVPSESGTYFVQVESIVDLGTARSCYVLELD